MGGDMTSTATFVGMPPFPTAAREALADSQLRHNLAHATGTIRAKRQRLVDEVEASGSGDGTWEALRLAGAGVKEQALRTLDEQLVRLEESLTANGATVHWATDITHSDTSRVVGAERRQECRVLGGEGDVVAVNGGVGVHGVEEVCEALLEGNLIPL